MHSWWSFLPRLIGGVQPRCPGLGAQGAVKALPMITSCLVTELRPEPQVPEPYPSFVHRLEPPARQLTQSCSPEVGLKRGEAEEDAVFQQQSREPARGGEMRGD